MNSANFRCGRVRRLPFFAMARRPWISGGKAALLTGLMVFGFAVSTFAATLVNDTWKDGTRTDPASPIYSENGTDSDADGNLESAWFNTDNTTSMSVVDDGVPGGDQLLRTVPSYTGSASWTTYLTPASTPVTLANVGDQLKITWVFTPTGVDATNTSNTGQNLRVAIVNWPEASLARLTGNSAPGSGAYAGYAMFMNMRTNSGGGFILKYRNAPGTASAFLSSSGSWTTLANDSSTGDGYFDNIKYTFVFQATLLSGGALAIASSMTGGTLGGDGQLSVTYTDAAPNSLTFDTFGIRPSAGNLTATNFDTSLFKVEFTPGGCSPTAYTVTGATTNCPGDSTDIGLSGSDSGVDYYLRLNGSDLMGPVAGTGSALDFGLQSTPGTYSVYASNTTVTCEGLLSSTAILANYANPVVTVNPSPVSAVNTVGNTRVFSITATGPGLTYRWRKDSSELINGGNISGADTATLTLNNLTLGDSGNYDCVVSNSPCGVSTISASANLSVISGTGILFRTVNSGNWSDASIWEQSSDGTTWNPASTPPSNLDSNITVRATHLVVVDADITVDQLTVAAGGTVSVQAGNFTLSNGDGIDCTVAGTLQVDAGSSTITTGSATLQFANGGVYNWNRAAAPAVPTATWLDGSTCRISATAAATVGVTGISGQSYYDFVYDTTANGQSTRTRLDISGTGTTIRHDFTVTLPDTANASLMVNNGSGNVLTVGRNVTFVTGATATSTKVLLNSAGTDSYEFRVGGNVAISGQVDGFGSSATYFKFNGTGTQTLTLPLGTALINGTTMNWLVNSGSTVALGGELDKFNTFTNQGTLTLGANLIAGGTTLVLAPGSTLNANGVNTIITNLNTIVAGGTLNLGSLPAFSGGESFHLIYAGTYGGAVNTLLPATPDGTHTWVTTQLNSAGILAVSGGTAPTLSVSQTGSALTFSWTDAGFKLQAQTNNASTGLGTNWADYPGGGTSPVNVTINPANPAVFFRLSQ